MSDIWLAIAEEEPTRPSARPSTKKSLATPDIWLAIAQDERTPTPRSSTSDRAAARAARPRPWAQYMSRPKSQAPVTTTASKPRSTPVASTSTSVDRLAAVRPRTTAQPSASLAIIRSEMDLFLADRHPAGKNAAKSTALPLAWEAVIASHERRWQAVRADSRRWRSAVAAKDDKTTCPCGSKFCRYRQVREKEAANAAAARREQITAARRERIAATQPPRFSKRLDRLEAMARDLAGQGKLTPFLYCLAICLLTLR